MTRKLGDRPLDELERRFQALRDQVAAMPEACRTELETALQEVSQAIGVLRADREAGLTPPEIPSGQEAPAGGVGSEPPAETPGRCETILSHVFSAIPDLLTVIDRDFNTILSNWHDHEFVPEAERQAHPKCYRVYHHRDRPCEPCHALKVLATGQPLRLERVNPVDGRFREIHAFPIKDESGRVVLVAEHVRDITERRLAEQALKESEERFRMLFEYAPDAYYLMDLQGNFLDVNRSTEELSGYGREEMIDKNYQILPLFDDQQQLLVAALLQQAVQGEILGPVELCLNRKEGGAVIIEAKGLPLYRKGESLLLGIARDITARKQAQEALLLSEARFRAIFEYAPVGIGMADLTGCYLQTNQSLQRFLGYTAEELRGMNFKEVTDPEDLPGNLRLRGELLGGQRQHYSLEKRYLRKDGEIVWAQVMVALLRDVQGEPQYLISTAIDITARKQAEAALRESETRFRHISSTISDISYSCTMAPDCGYDIDWMAGAAERITGYSVEEIKARRCWKFLVIEADQPLFEKQITGLAAGSSGACELRLRHKNGGIVWVAAFAKIVQEPERPELLTMYGGLVDISARKQAEAALAAHLQFLQLLLDTIPNPIFFKDAQGAYLGCNKAFEDYLGVTREEIVGKSVYDLSPPELADEYHRMDLKAFQTSGTQVYESRVQAADGAQRHVVFHKATFPAPDGSVGGLVGIIIDITARKQAEEALRESEELYRSLFENMLNGFAYCKMLFDQNQPQDFIYLDVNRSFEALTGLKDVIGKKVSEVIPGLRESNPELLEIYGRVALTGKPEKFETYVEALKMWLSISVYSPAKEYFVAIFDGITARKQAEAALRESEQRFRLMAETIQDVFWIGHPALSKIEYVSPMYEQVWGRTCQELYQSPWSFLEAIHPEDLQRVRSEISATQAQNIPWSHDYRIIKPDGAVRWIQDRGFPVRDDQGRVTLVTGVATDVTERKALEQQLLQAQKMEAVGRLAGGVAHDFNNLLMAITGYGELMRAKVHKGDPLYGHLENILKASDRAAALTQQLLTFSRRQIVHPQVIDLNRVVLDLEPMLRRLIGEDLDLEVVTDRRLGAVKADPGQLGQIIMNLVVNARDAMPRGGRLTLRTAPVDCTVGCYSRFGLMPPGPYVMLVVQDTGVGMDEATQTHVFEPFFTTKEPGKGTGLGLSTVYGIVKQSGGCLDLVSEPGAGSTFTIYLPRLEAIVEPPKAKIPITASFQGEETVLLVEDEEVLRGLLAKFLRLYGYTVLEARHGGEALLICERHQGLIHVMVTDVVMPQMSGRELADRLTPLRPEMKIIYMSGYTEDALVQHGVADLSAGFLQKPFKPLELARRVHAVLHPPVSR